MKEKKRIEYRKSRDPHNKIMIMGCINKPLLHEILRFIRHTRSVTMLTASLDVKMEELDAPSRTNRFDTRKLANKKVPRYFIDSPSEEDHQDQYQKLDSERVKTQRQLAYTKSIGHHSLRN
ncbi:hypothetical protein KIN20_016418 [Parelaphostrongylus tenuis]|uniref:Uncharacterized protein n=1 Tax=Parelaphostrongylus tenuis TaxID=148309 RepID=A0AAD5QPS0_PARTN|nr:hypothetical protein KIN20_016418 [Parelaphostrongylus tenuis]